DRVVVNPRIGTLDQRDAGIGERGAIRGMVDHVVADDAARVSPSVHSEADAAIAIDNQVALDSVVGGAVPEVDGELRDGAARARDVAKRIVSNSPVLRRVRVDASD